MANEENHVERKQAENRRRDIQADLDAQKAKSNKEKFDEQRKEALKRQRERREAEITHSQRNSHNLDFSGHEKHGTNEVSAKIHTVDLNEDYQRQAAQYSREQRTQEIEKKQSPQKKQSPPESSASHADDKHSSGQDKHIEHFSNKPQNIPHRHSEDYQRQTVQHSLEQRMQEIEKKQSPIKKQLPHEPSANHANDKHISISEQDKHIGYFSDKAKPGKYKHSEEYQRQAVQHSREQRMQEIEKKPPQSKRQPQTELSASHADGKHSPIPEKDKHMGHFSGKPQNTPNKHSEDYQRQTAQHSREQRVQEIEKKQSENHRYGDNVCINSGSAKFSSYGVGKVYTTHFENSTITHIKNKIISPQCRLLSPKTANNVSQTQMIHAYPSRTLGSQGKHTTQSEREKHNSYYTSRTFNNQGQNFSQNQTRSNNRDNIPDLSETSTRFRYVKQAVQQGMYTTQRVYSAVGQSVYNISQNGDYGTIHTFERVRRGAVGTVAAIRVIRNMPHNTVARTAAIGSYAKATILNVGRYIKGTNTAKLLSEAEKLHSSGVLTMPQMQEYKRLQSQLQINAQNIVYSRPLTTLKQVRSEINRVFTAEQLKDLAAQYGNLAKLSLKSIDSQLRVLNRKKEFGSLTAAQSAKLTRLGELKEIHKSALKEHKKLLSLSSGKLNREIRKLKKLQKSGAFSAAHKVRLDKLTELKSLYDVRRNIKKNIRARHRMRHSIMGAMRQLFVKSENPGINGLFMATDLATNRYVHIIIKEIGKLNHLLMRTAAKPVILAAKTAADKTGLTKQVTKFQTNAVNKVINSKPAQTVKKLQQQVNGKAYNAVKKKISAKAPQGLKTAAKKITSSASKVSKTTNKVTQTLKKGVNIAAKPFKAVKKVVSMVFKAAKGVVIVSGGAFLLLFFIVAAVSVISSLSSVIMEDTDNLNEYIQYLNNNQTQFKQTLTSLGEGYRNVTYKYTDGSKMNNTREILCMAAVYLQQDFEDKNAVKTYLSQMFNASHFCSTQESETYYCSSPTCHGHKDLTVTITALAFDEIFNASVNSTGVGDLCFAFETGGQTLGSYNVWYCEDIYDGAGMNYGMMSTNREQATSMWNYIKSNSPNLASRFAGVDGFTGNNLHPFSDTFNARWKGTHTAEETAEMEKLQRAWVWNAYGSIWCADLKSHTGVDMTRSWALKEVALSRAVHRGAYSASSFYSCVNSAMTDEEIIDAIYNHECSTLSRFMSRWNLERGYAKSFLGRTEPTDDSSDQFSWDEGNIEWCKNLYDQNWEELYPGLEGLNGVSVGSAMTESEIEALIGSIDGLSQERKNILSWACSAIGKIPYHWDWRSYWTIDAEDWGTPCTPDYKGRNLKGLDCSGFVIWCYNKSGYTPDVCGWGSTGWTGTIADSAKTVKISQSELKPGDIGMVGSYPYTHTGIYAGNGKWIHCTGALTNNTVCNAYGGFTTYYRMTDLD